VVSQGRYVWVERMPNGFGDRVWLLRSVLALYLVCSIFAAYTVYQQSGVVHGTLYNYGLQFSNGWAIPYWSLERLIYVYVFVPSFFGSFALIFDLWKSRLERVPAVRRIENNIAPGIVGPVVQTADKNNSMTINCPKCSCLFSRPMNMLDFSSGKAQLVNVCPYCNQVLGDVEHEDVKFRVVEPDEEEVLERR
jgi:hypothetical protein